MNKLTFYYWLMFTEFLLWIATVYFLYKGMYVEAILVQILIQSRAIEYHLMKQNKGSKNENNNE